MTKDFCGHCSWRWCAAPMPDTPAPTISTSTCSVTVVDGRAVSVSVMALLGAARRREQRGVERREWDSNPRYPEGTTVFETVRFGHSRIPPGPEHDDGTPSTPGRGRSYCGRNAEPAGARSVVLDLAELERGEVAVERVERRPRRGLEVA